MSEHRCAGEVWSRDLKRWLPCTNAARYEVDGGHWCGLHLSSAERARDEKRDARNRERWAVENAANQAKRARERAVHAACAGVDDPQPGELARLRAEVARLRERG